MTERNTNGTFHIAYRDGYATLTIHPPTGRGHSVYADDVRNRLRILGVPHVRAERIHEIIDRTAGVPERLVRWPDGERLSSTMDVRISEDGMHAYLVIHPPKKGGGTPDSRRIREVLQSHGVVHGIVDDTVNALAQQPRFDTEIEIAAGTPPTHGKPRTAELTFTTAVGKPYRILSGGRIDLKELNYIQNKDKDDILARYVPPTPAADGRSVTGDVVQADPPGPDNCPGPGENTTVSEDGDTVYAGITGNVFVKDRRIHMEPLVTVETVDYATGNLDFNGSIVVRRSVADGFTVKAVGTIQIGECVGRAEIRAGRDVVLSGGVNADHEGIIESGGDLHAKYVEGANVVCGGNLIADELIMHSAVTAHGDILLHGRRAEIIGGYAVAGGSVWCKQAGSTSEVQTRLTVGIDPAALAEFGEVRKALEAKRDELDEIERTIRRLHHRGERRSDDEDKIKRAIEHFSDKRVATSGAIESLVKQYHQLRDALVAPPHAMAVIEGDFFPGVVVSFGKEEFRVSDKAARGTVLRLSGGGIVEEGYNPANPPELHAEGPQ